ncbi:MAG: hypothetical protein ACRDBO_11625 [Lachnospiraceae bacterium]
MDEFKVYPKVVDQLGSDIYGYGKAISNYRTAIGIVKVGLRGKIAGQEKIGSRLKQIMETMDVLKGNANDMGNRLETITQLYKQAEKHISDNHLTYTTNTMGEKETAVDSALFDDIGQYGGNQGGPKSSDYQDELYTIIRKYYPEMTSEQVENYFIKMNSEGCGYVAVINTIFMAFEGKEDEFERTFGFPMYENGDLNFDKLFVDFYSRTDNHVEIFGMDYNNTREDYHFGDGGFWLFYDQFSDQQGKGTTPTTLPYRAQLYLQEKGVDLTISSSVEVTTENFAQISKDQQVIMYYYNGPLDNLDGSCVQNISGHAMTVTGVTSDGRYIVSSWGRKYYVDSAKGGTIQFDSFKYS